MGGMWGSGGNGPTGWSPPSGGRLGGPCDPQEVQQCQVQGPAQGSERSQSSLGGWVRSSPEEKDLGCGLMRTWQCALADQKASCVLAASKEAWPAAPGR